MATKKIGRWKGGFIGKSNVGTITYYIEKRIGKTAYCMSLRTDNLDIAEHRFKQFLRNPDNFTVNGYVENKPLLFSVALIEDFLAYSQVKKENCESWVTDQRRYLMWWRESLGEKDLRNITLADITSRLRAGMSAERLRITVLKSFFRWLRGARGELSASQDPLLDTINLSDYKKPAKHRKAITPDELATVKARMEPEFMAAFTLHEAIACHCSELERFSTSGQIDGNVVTFVHKNGYEQKNELSDRVLAAAKQLRAQSMFTADRYKLAVIRAADKAGIKFTAGAMRHTIITHARKRGISEDSMKKIVGHSTNSPIMKMIYDQSVAPVLASPLDLTP